MLRQTPRNVLQVERRRPDGSVQVHRVVRADGGSLEVEVTPWLPASESTESAFLLRTTPWTRLASVEGFDLAQLLAHHGWLLELHGGEVTHVTVDEGELSRVSVVPHLQPTGDEPERPERWDADTAARWSSVDALLPSLLRGADWCPRWADVNGTQVGVLRVPRTGEAGALRAVLVELDEQEESAALLSLAPIAEHWTYSEGGVTSWVGGSCVELVGRDVARAQGTGDNDPDPTLLLWPAAHEGRAAALTQWIDNHQAHVAAALALEPLDPGGALDDDAREEWEELLASCGTSLSVTDSEVADCLRGFLDADAMSPYRATRLALADPLGPAGLALRQRLDAACDGDLMPLLVG